MSFVQYTQIAGWTTSKARRFSKAEQYILARFFDTEPFLARGWDIYHYETSTRDYFLLSVQQVITFFEYVYKQTGLAKNLHGLTERQLSFRIESADTPPFKIGVVHTQKEYDELVAKHAWKQEDNPTKKKDEKERKARRQREKKALAFQSWRSQVRLARQILGLGQHACAADDAVDPSPVIQDRELPMLIAIDVEAWERDRNKVTEIGISILDTALIPPLCDLPNLTIHDIDMELYHDDLSKRPRTRADTIVDLIQRRHIRILEHKNLRNGMYVSDAADKFDFGTSEWLSLRDVPAMLGEVFRNFDANGNKRKVMLVGHDVKQDLEYLRITGYDVWNIKDLEVLDTATMNKAIAQEYDPRSLSKVLMDLGVIFWNLHNAGNDAAYTLEAFVRLAEKGVSDSEVKVPEPTVAPADLLEKDRDAYEQLIDAGCVRWVASQDRTLGPRPRKVKKSAAEIAHEAEVADVVDAWASTPAMDVDVGKHQTGWD